MKTVLVLLHHAHAWTTLTILHPKTCRSQISTPVPQPGHGRAPRRYRQVRSHPHLEPYLGRADENNTSAYEALLKTHTEFERKFFLLHDRITFARTVLQMTSVKDRDVPAGVLDHALTLQRLRQKRHGCSPHTEHLCD